MSLITNGVDPDEMPHDAAFYFGLHYIFAKVNSIQRIKLFMYVAYAQAYLYIFICKLKNPFFHDMAHALFHIY